MTLRDLTTRSCQSPAVTEPENLERRGVRKGATDHLHEDVAVVRVRIPANIVDRREAPRDWHFQVQTMPKPFPRDQVPVDRPPMTGSFSSLKVNAVFFAPSKVTREP